MQEGRASLERHSSSFQAVHQEHPPVQAKPRHQRLLLPGTSGPGHHSMLCQQHQPVIRPHLLLPGNPSLLRARCSLRNLQCLALCSRVPRPQRAVLLPQPPSRSHGPRSETPSQLGRLHLPPKPLPPKLLAPKPLPLLRPWDPLVPPQAYQALLLRLHLPQEGLALGQDSPELLSPRLASLVLRMLKGRLELGHRLQEVRGWALLLQHLLLHRYLRPPLLPHLRLRKPSL